jgi:hypothetical protein
MSPRHCGPWRDVATQALIIRVARDDGRLAEPPDHGGAFYSFDHREGSLKRSRYHRLSVVQRFNVLCDRSQIRV